VSGQSKVSAAVLAGGAAKVDIAAATGQGNRALIPVEGVPMIQRVVSALLNSGVIAEVAVAGDVPESSAYRRVPDQAGFVENLFAAMAAAKAGEYVLIAMADVPFLSAESVADLVNRGIALGADMVYPVVNVADCYARFPGMKRTAVKTREGEFTGGNLALGRRQFLLEQRARLQEAYGLRKSPGKLARMLGFGTLFRFAASRIVGPRILSITHLEHAVSRLLGGRARALISPYPELATDIDRAEDLRALESVTRH
jgi:CTP:molybdopterin cytidylyltransferase MocA